eukprot:1240935-Prymnesium_polylepis.1
MSSVSSSPEPSASSAWNWSRSRSTVSASTLPILRARAGERRRVKGRRAAERVCGVVEGREQCMAGAGFGVVALFEVEEYVLGQRDRAVVIRGDHLVQVLQPLAQRLLGAHLARLAK